MSALGTRAGRQHGPRGDVVKTEGAATLSPLGLWEGEEPRAVL